MTPVFKEFLVFELSGMRLGLELDAVEEVVPRSTISPVPMTAKFVSGVAAVRGRIMSVIDGGIRYGLQKSKGDFFLVCQVRENQTAVIIDRPIEASQLGLVELGSDYIDNIVQKNDLSNKFFNGAWEILEKDENDETWAKTGRAFLSIDSDMFVSDQMASQIG